MVREKNGMNALVVGGLSKHFLKTHIWAVKPGSKTESNSAKSKYHNEHR